jgi:hypothetical protein
MDPNSDFVNLTEKNKKTIYHLLALLGFITSPQHIKRVAPIPSLDTVTSIPQGTQTYIFFGFPAGAFLAGFLAAFFFFTGIVHLL